MSKERILVVTPHADDESFGLGGTILKHVRRGQQVHVVVVVAGDVRFEHTNGVIVDRRTREEEFLAVVNRYGCTGEMLSFSQEARMDTVPVVEVVNELERVQDRVKAGLWYVPGPSFHQDHRAVYEACMAAARPTRTNTPDRLLMYETPLYSWNPRAWRLEPHLYEEISEELDEKIEICRLYRSQVRVGVLSPDHVRDYNLGCGTEIGVRAAERFEVVRMLNRGSC